MQIKVSPRPSAITGAVSVGGAMVKSRLRLSKMSRGRAMIIYSECKITSKPSFETGHTASSVNLEGSDYGNRRSERLICYFLHIKSLEDQSVLKKTTLFLCEY